MESAKKMLLVEPGVLEKLKQENNTISPLSRLDKEMQNILNRKLDDREKWSLYLQTLQRYLHFTEEERKPLLLPLITDATPTLTEIDNQLLSSYKKEEHDDKRIVPHRIPSEDVKQSGSIVEKPLYSTKHVLKLIPKTYLKKGELLMETILAHNDKITWNDVGTVFIDKQEISGSNIIDLVNDTLRSLQSNPNPIGWERFTEALRDIKVPLSYIGNKNRIKHISKAYFEDVVSGRKSSSPDEIRGYDRTPISHNKTGILRRTIDWDKWSPY